MSLKPFEALDKLALTSKHKTCSHLSSHPRKGLIHPLWESLVHSLLERIIAEQEKNKLSLYYAKPLFKLNLYQLFKFVFNHVE